MRHLYLISATCLALASNPIDAAIYKCTRPGGQVSFEDRPCKQGTQETLEAREIPTQGAPGTAGGEGSAASGDDAAQAMASGTLYGEPFIFTKARVQKLGAYVLEIQQGAGVRPDKEVTIFLWGSEHNPPAGRVFNIPDPTLTQQPQIILIWTTADGQRRQEEILAGYTMQLEFAQESNGKIEGHIALALPDKSTLDINGNFTATIDY